MIERRMNLRALLFCGFLGLATAIGGCGGGSGGGSSIPAAATGGSTPSPSPSVNPTGVPTSSASDIDWPTQGFDAARSGDNPSEHILTTASAGGLHLLWSSRIGSDATSKYANSQPVVAAGVPVGGVPTDIVYTGDEHGYFAAFNAMNGTMLWRKALGSMLTGCGDIPDKTFGITDAAAIDHARNRVYVVDGTGVLWAFDLATGNVSPGWSANGISVVDDPSIDHVWSGLAFNSVNNTLYVPTASFCDMNRWHGALRAVNTQSAAVTSVYYFATGTSSPPGASGPYGGGVWSWGGVSIDNATQNLFAASGNTNPQVSSPGSNESMTEWNSSLGLIANYFPSIGNGDLDFGGNAVLYNASGKSCVAAYSQERTTLHVRSHEPQCRSRNELANRRLRHLVAGLLSVDEVPLLQQSECWGARAGALRAPNRSELYAQSDARVERHGCQRELPADQHCR